MIATLGLFACSCGEILEKREPTVLSIAKDIYMKGKQYFRLKDATLKHGFLNVLNKAAFP